MNMGGGVMGSMSIPIAKTTRKAVDSGPDPFPVGLRVLVVDDDPTCLIILEKMLRTCRYHVTKTNRAEVALSMLRENRNGFDIVISDVHMPDMDGFKLLEHVGLEMDLPVIMMSADDSNNVVMKGVTHGACDYLIKPVRIEALKNIWQHVIRKKKNELKEAEQSCSWDDGDREQKQDDAALSPANESSWKSSKRKGEDEDSDERDDTTTLKKPRVVWSVELHQQFVGAVNQLGIEKAVPKKILEMMNVPGLTRENVASHLQKYRLYLKRLSGVSQQQGGYNAAFMSHDSGFGAMSSLGGMDLQTLHATGHLSAQTLAAYTRYPPPIKPGISMPFVDQRSLFSFETSSANSKPRYEMNGLNSKQMNLLHGIPTTMEPRQLAGLSHSSSQNIGNMNLQRVPPLHVSRSQSLPGHGHGQVAMQSNANVNAAVLSRNGMSYNPVSQAGPGVDYSSTINQTPEMPGNGFPLGSTPGLTALTSKGYNNNHPVENTRNNGNNLDGNKAVRGYVGSYDVFSEADPHSSRDWHPTMNFASSSQHSTSLHHNSGNMGVVGPSVLDNGQHLGMHNANMGHGPGPGLGLGSSVLVKAETFCDIPSPGTTLFSQHYDQDDLMSALLKQQEGIGTNDYEFEGYTLDNIPVQQ